MYQSFINKINILSVVPVVPVVLGNFSSVRTIQTNGFLPYSNRLPWNTGNSQLSDFSIQIMEKEQRLNFWSTHITKKFTRFSNNTQQKKLETDNAVNIFIQNITKLRGLKNTSLSIQIMEIFNTFKQHVNTSYLTNDHRKQFLTIIPTISKIIDKKI